MISAYLYNTHSKKLKSLDADQLLASTPSAREASKKGDGPEPSDERSHEGRPQCRDNEFVWVDVTAPTEDEFNLLMERFGLHAMIIEDIKGQEGRPKLHDYPEHLYVIFHAMALAKEPEEVKSPAEPSVNPKDAAAGGRFKLQLTEIDCLIGPDYILTIHARPVPPFDDLRGRWERRPEMMQLGPSYLLYELMDEVLDDYFPLLDDLDEFIDEFEDRLFTSFNETLSSDIFSLKRCLLQVRRIAGPTRDVANTLLRHDAENGGHFFAYYQDLYDHATRIVDMIDTFRDILSGALDAYLAIQSNRMAIQGNRLNEVMKTLTSWSIILLIPTLIAGIYGMNFEHMPELKWKYGYFVVLGVMATVIITLTAYFKRRRWL